jgi:hypothetical protein
MLASLIELCVKYSDLVPAGALSRVQRQVGLAHEFKLAEPAALSGDPNRRSHLNFMACDDATPIAGFLDLQTELLNAGVRGCFNKNPELIASQTGKHSTGRYDGRYIAANLFYELVAGKVAQSIVDGLEAIQINHQDDLILVIASESLR